MVSLLVVLDAIDHRGFFQCLHAGNANKSSLRNVQTVRLLRHSKYSIKAVSAWQRALVLEAKQ